MSHEQEDYCSVIAIDPDSIPLMGEGVLSVRLSLFPGYHGSAEDERLRRNGQFVQLIDDLIGPACRMAGIECDSCKEDGTVLMQFSDFSQEHTATKLLAIAFRWFEAHGRLMLGLTQEWEGQIGMSAGLARDSLGAIHLAEGVNAGFLSVKAGWPVGQTPLGLLAESLDVHDWRESLRTLVLTDEVTVPH